MLFQMLKSVAPTELRIGDRFWLKTFHSYGAINERIKSNNSNLTLCKKNSVGAKCL